MLSWTSARRGAGDALVRTICLRLDGLPLAIELAAAQLRHLSLTQLSRRLDERLRPLIGGRPRVGERHVTLAATIDWSFRLLSPKARDTFVLLGVFPATFDLEATAAVAAEHDRTTLTHDVGELVAKSLLVHDRDRDRFRMLETIRLYAAERLAAGGRAGEAAEALRRHVVTRARIGSRTAAWLSGSLAAASRDDLDNVRWAFRASIEAGLLDDAVDIALALSSLWRNAVGCAEANQWIDALRPLGLAPSDRAWLDVIDADVGLGSGDPRRMRAAAQRVLDRPGTPDPAASVVALVYLALIFLDPQSRGRLREAQTRAEAMGEPALARMAAAFGAVGVLLAGHGRVRRELTVQMEQLVDEAATSDGYDRYITIWAWWCLGLARRDGPGLLTRMDRQLDNVTRTGLGVDWRMEFCHALTLRTPPTSCTIASSTPASSRRVSDRVMARPRPGRWPTCWIAAGSDRHLLGRVVWPSDPPVNRAEAR
jgi:hypothetical protein